MQLSRFEALGMIPDKEKVTVYIYRSRRRPGQLPVKRKIVPFDEFISGMPDEISAAALCFIKEAERLGPMVRIVLPTRKFYLKPDPKKMKRFEKLNGYELDYEKPKFRRSFVS